jgi:mono/diheme cytochrome c family protein
MPPEGLLSEADVTTFAKWIDEGMPEGTCGAVDGNSHTPIELKCTSARFWTEGDDEGDELMTPGQACISCHTKENLEHSSKDDDDDDHELEAPAFTAAGTVYPTLHEPDDCFGLGTKGTQVVITGADGKKLTLAVNRAGNFMTEEAIALPYKASVVRGGKTRSMKTAQDDGDCNKCHTAEGGDAPGRIVGP